MRQLLLAQTILLLLLLLSFCQARDKLASISMESTGRMETDMLFKLSRGP